MNNNHYCVIMAGGIGSRLWPLSRVNSPKQFMEIPGTGQSLLQHTYERFRKFIPQDNIIVVSSERYRDLVMSHLPELKEENLLLDPYIRNTAPCTAYASYHIIKRNPEATVVFSPSDHVITDYDNFSKDILNALEYAAENKVLMTLGIVPSRPDSNYGYIQATGGKDICHSNKIVKVKTFVEKPDRSLAKVFLDSGEFFWNAGVFISRADVMIEEMDRYVPEITRYFTGWEQIIGSKAEEEFITKAFSGCSNISISYAVMEKTDRAWLYPASFDWREIGSWESFHDSHEVVDKDGNVTNASKMMLDEAKNNMISCSHKGKMVAIKGLEGYTIVDTDDVLMICPKNDKKFNNFISGLGMPEYDKYR